MAEALGRFGQQGLDAAFYWTYPPENSPAFWAFRAYRNYDGQGAHFLDQSVPTRRRAKAPRSSPPATPRAGTSPWWRSTCRPGRCGMAQLLLKGCAPVAQERVFTWAGDPAGFALQKEVGARTVRLPPYSMTVIELALDRPKKSAR